MWEVRAVDELLWARFGDHGAVFVMKPDGSVREQLSDPGFIEPMVPLDEAVESVLELIKDVPLAKAARVALGKALDVDPDHIGKTSTRRATS